ncbi:MAG: Rieske 2Fe-2S domain-containing protein [Acidimicrobiia bacterium]
MWIIVAIVVVIGLAVIVIVSTARRRANVGTLARETRRRDTGSGASTAEPGTDLATVGAEARDRAGEAKQSLAPSAPRTPAVAEPVDPEVLGETRRQFLNRGIVAGMALALGALGVAVVGFLWPPNTGAAGFGGVIDVGSLSEIDDTIDNKKQPFYNAAAKTWVVAYPKADLPKAKQVQAYTQVAGIIKGMEQGYVALYQKCVHLGCRVPFCQTSQWFECPCHGSKYNRVGEKRGGPAPRGLDRFIPIIAGGRLSVDTGTIVQGPPIGTDTTGQSPEGAPCV